MRLKLDHFKRNLDKSKKLPGPGTYASNDLTGKGLSMSVMKNSVKSSVPKQARFMESQKFTTPPPNIYDVKDGLNLNFNSRRHNAGQTVFGSNQKTYVDFDWKLEQKRMSPGPGAYTTFSDFGGNQ